MSAPRQRRSDYISYTCHIAEVLRTTHYSNEICDVLKTTQTSKKYSFPSYFGFIQTSAISRVHSCIAKNSCMPRMNLLLVVFSFFKKNYLLLSHATSARSSVCPSVRLCQ